MNNAVSGFSKLSKEDKINWIATTYFSNPEHAVDTIKQYWNSDNKLQQLHDEFIENTISNFYVPYAIAPNFLINGKTYAIPMAIEESSVVAAAALTAKFWSSRGGFNTKVISTTKVGQVHFTYEGGKRDLEQYFLSVKKDLIHATDHITVNMRKRGGGIVDIELRDRTDSLEHYYQLHVTFVLEF